MLSCHLKFTIKSPAKPVENHWFVIWNEWIIESQHDSSPKQGSDQILHCTSEWKTCALLITKHHSTSTTWEVSEEFLHHEVTRHPLSCNTQAPTSICSAHCPSGPRHKVLDVIKAIWVRFNHWENWAARFSPPSPPLSPPISDRIQSLIRESIDWCNLIGMWGEWKNTIDCFCLWHMLLSAADAYPLSSTV